MMPFDGVHTEGPLSWSEFKSELYRRIATANQAAGAMAPNIEPKHFVFRGHGNSDWALETAFDRRWKKKAGATNQDIEELYTQALAKFFDDCDYYGISEEKPAVLNVRDYLEQRGQHHGFPTRLLDWSASPYVAAFFAFSDAGFSTTGRVALWALDVRAMQLAFRKEDLSLIRNPISNNPRMRMQLGSFTRNATNISDLRDVLSFAAARFRTKPKHPIAFKFEIPVGEASAALADLETMGIDYVRLFPGIEGVCKSHCFAIEQASR